MNKITNKKLKKAFKKLDALYDKLPNTKGCMENIDKEGGCAAWCCRIQSPSLLYVEFRNTWSYMIKNWDLNKIVSIIRRSIENYLSNNLAKGCIFLDKDNNVCEQHKSRCYNCRIYGITPEDEFKPRYEKLKVLYEDRGEEIRDQCNLVSTVDEKPVTKKMIDKWWQELVDVEEGLGFKQSEINDLEGGTYRTYHDHLLLHLFPEDVLESLTYVKLNGSPVQKIEAIDKFTDLLREMLQNAQQSKDN